MRYFLGFLISIGLIIFVFILVLKGLSGDPTSKDQPVLSDYANTNSVMRLTVDGPIVSEQEHQAYRITVGNSETHIETLQGYEYNMIDTKNYANNQESYINFLRALDLAGFTKGIADAANKDERGVCAKGNRFIMEIRTGSSEVQRYWSAECPRQGTFKGNSAEVHRLFNAQIPAADFSKMTSRLKI